MKNDAQKIFSLAAVIVAATLFGMVLSGGFNITQRADADLPDPAPAAQVGEMVLPDFVALADHVVPSVVSVYSDDVQDPSERSQRMPNDPFHFFFGPRDDGAEREPQVRRSSGSGFFISSSGEILTNHHVIEDADSIKVRLSDETEYRVEVVGIDPATDIALLRVVDPDRDFSALALGDSAAVRVGQWVMAAGNPLDMAHSVTVGVVSAKGRSLGLSAASSSFENFIQTDAAINFGNSGGPLVNLKGNVIGINTAINAAGQNIGFAVPIDVARRILPQLRENGRVVRGYLGVSIGNLTKDDAEAFGLENTNGALVEEVVEGHAAAKAGIRHGDVLVSVDGASIEDTRELIDTISAKPPGTRVELGVIRNGKKTTIEVTLEEREADATPEEAGDDSNSEGDVFERVGVTVIELSPMVREKYRIETEVEGVVVTRVRPLSPASEEGMAPGLLITEANGQPIDSPAELRKVVEEIDAGGYLRLYVYMPRADRYRFVILKLEE
ncbi:MAG: Do family serine endopeptidase [Acidobacteriota bacterium]|nr:Do family serine endopeptidase [Acidobacteriota bacterium]